VHFKAMWIPIVPTVVDPVHYWSQGSQKLGTFGQLSYGDCTYGVRPLCIRPE